MVGSGGGLRCQCACGYETRVWEKMQAHIKGRTSTCHEFKQKRIRQWLKDGIIDESQVRIVRKEGRKGGKSRS